MPTNYEIVVRRGAAGEEEPRDTLLESTLVVDVGQPIKLDSENLVVAEIRPTTREGAYRCLILEPE